MESTQRQAAKQELTYALIQYFLQHLGRRPATPETPGSVVLKNMRPMYPALGASERQLI